MKIDKEKLQEALEIVKPALASKEVIEQTTSFAFINGRVIAYNDEISISHPVEGINFTGAIYAENLYKLLSKLKAPKKKEEDGLFMIDLEVEEAQVILSSGRTKAGLALQSEISLPLDEEVAIVGKWKDIPDPENFRKFLKMAMGSCSRDMSTPVLTAVHVNEAGFIEASDGYKLTRCTLAQEMPIRSFLIPATSAAEVIKIYPIKIATGNGWIHFKNEEDTILSCRIFEDNFPDITQHLKVKGIKVILPQSTEKVLDKAMIFSKRDHVLEEMVTVTIGDRRLKIRAESDTGWFEEELNIKHDGDQIQFYVTPYLLKDILAETQECVIGESKLKFNGEGWEYVSMLRNFKK